jgi:hypothetical protein
MPVKTVDQCRYPQKHQNKGVITAMLVTSWDGQSDTSNFNPKVPVDQCKYHRTSQVQSGLTTMPVIQLHRVKLIAEYRLEIGGQSLKMLSNASGTT